MKLAIIGSRGITLNDIEKYLPQEIDAFDEIVSGVRKVWIRLPQNSRKKTVSF